MSKTKEELDDIKNEYNNFLTKAKDLTDEELNEVTGGFFPDIFASMNRNVNSLYRNQSITNNLNFFWR